MGSCSSCDHNVERAVHRPSHPHSLFVLFAVLTGKWHLGGMREENRLDRTERDACVRPSPNQHGFEEYISGKRNMLVKFSPYCVCVCVSVCVYVSVCVCVCECVFVSVCL